MDEIEQRLKDTAEATILAYEVWGKSKKNAEARERLQEAVHELRKVAARLEIEVAVSERDEMTQRPIPVPPHRASRSRYVETGNELPDFITDNAGNEDSPEDRQPFDNQGQSQQNRSNNRPQRGPQTGGGQRRPLRRPGFTPNNNPQQPE